MQLSVLCGEETRGLHLIVNRKRYGYIRNGHRREGIPALWRRILGNAQNVRLQRMGHTAPFASAQDDVDFSLGRRRRRPLLPCCS